MATMNVSTLSAEKDVVTDPSRTFNVIFENEQSLLRLLVAVRGSSILPEQKLDLRDSVLEYSSTENPAEKQKLKEKITKILSDHEKDFLSLIGRRIKPEKPVSELQKDKVPTQEVIAKEKTISTPRPRPSFGVPKAQTVEVEQEAVTKPVAASDTTTIKTEPEQEKKEIPQTPEAPKVVGSKPETVVAPASNAAIQTRINEIKHYINAKVGNPINLISKDKVVGQEYMAALLDAMKKSSTGSTDADASLIRLENAYQAALDVIAKNPEDIKTKPEVTTSSQNPKVKKSTPSNSSSNEKELKTDVSKPQSPIVNKIPTKELHIRNIDKDLTELTARPSATKVKEDVVSPETDVTEFKSSEGGAKSVTKKPSGLKRLADKLLFRTSLETPATKDKKAVSKETQVTPTPVPIKPKATEITNKETTGPIKSVASVTTLPEKMTELQKNLEKKKEEKKQPVKGLDAPEVTEGLEQLLSEWKLFKGSGFLGGGPGGKNHPLYKKLENLPMVAVVSGRFEGATPEIKQRLTDYMNGWRYEHGIVHEMGETFEHYLRRVILHIIDKNRSLNAAKEKTTDKK